MVSILLDWQTWTNLGFVAAVVFSIGVMYPDAIREVFEVVGFQDGPWAAIVLVGCLVFGFTSIIMGMVVTPDPKEETPENQNKT